MSIASRLRVLCIGHPYVLAINRAVARELARDTGFEVTVAAPNTFRGDLRPLTLEPEPADSQLRIVGLNSYASRFIHLFHFNSRALRSALHAQEFDIVYAWSEPYVYTGWQIARAVSATGNGKFCFRTAQNLSKLYPPPFNMFERQTIARSAGWLACGDLVFRTMIDRGYNSALGKVIPLAVDTNAFFPLEDSKKREVLHELRLEPPVIGFLGRLTAAKGISVILSALEMISRTQKWSLLCMGSGPEEERIRNWARKNDCQRRVCVKLVKHDEVPRYLGAVDVLVAPSQTTARWKEQFGRMIVEAFASGVPVIGSDSGEIPFVIGDAGVVVEESDVAAWSLAISSLLADPKRREELVERGYERAREFSARRVAGQYAQFFRELVQ